MFMDGKQFRIRKEAIMTACDWTDCE